VPTPPIDLAGPGAAKDKVVNVLDISALLWYGFAVDNGPPNFNGADCDDDKNGNLVEDGAEYDYRSSSGWGPDGRINVLDASSLLAQGFDSCQAPP
jgi:hypothetical protein